MLTGKPPFRAGTPLDTILQVLEREPEPPSRLQPGIPRDLETICLKCLQKDSGKRYGSATELADDLDRYREGRPILARPVGTWERAWRWCRRNPAVAALSAVAAVCFLGGGIASLLFGLHANRRANEAIQANAAKDNALIHSDGLRLLARSEVERPRDPVLGLLLAIEGGERGRPRDLQHNNTLLASIFACKERRTFDGERVLDALRDRPRSVNDHICFRHAELSDDGRRLLTVADTTGLEKIGGNVLQVWDTDTGRLRTVIHVPVLDFETARLSPDGERIVTTIRSWSHAKYADGKMRVFTQRAVRVWDAATGKEVAVLRGHGLRVVSAVFSPDSKRIVTASWDQTARVWDAATGKLLALIKAEPFPLKWARFTPDGQRVLTFSLDADIRGIAERGDVPGAIVDAALPEVGIQQILGGSASSFEPGGSWGTHKGDAPPRLWDASTGQHIATLGQGPEVKDQTTAAAVSPDGSLIVTGFYWGDYTNAMIRKLFLWDGKTGKSLGQVGRIFELHLTERVETLQFSADGKRLLVVYGKSAQLSWDRRIWQVVEVIDVPSKRVVAQRILTVEKRMGRKEHETEMKVRHAELSPDGRQVLLLLGDNWKLRDRRWTIWFDDQSGKPSLQEGLDPVVHLWDVERDEMTQLVGHGNDAVTAHYSRDGLAIVTAAVDGTAKLWDAHGGRGAVTVLNAGGDGLAIARFSPDGRWVATLRGQLPFRVQHDPNPERRRQPDGKTVRLWEAATGRLTEKLVGLPDLKDQGSARSAARRRRRC